MSVYDAAKLVRVEWASWTRQCKLKLCWRISFGCYTAHSPQGQSRGFIALSTSSYLLLLIRVGTDMHDWSIRLVNKRLQMAKNQHGACDVKVYLRRSNTTRVSYQFFYFIDFKAYCYFSVLSKDKPFMGKIILNFFFFFFALLPFVHSFTFFLIYFFLPVNQQNMQSEYSEIWLTKALKQSNNAVESLLDLFWKNFRANGRYFGPRLMEEKAQWVRTSDNLQTWDI